MPLETIAVLGTVIAMFVIFGTTLAWAAYRTGSPAEVEPKTAEPAE